MLWVLNLAEAFLMNTHIFYGDGEVRNIITGTLQL